MLCGGAKKSIQRLSQVISHALLMFSRLFLSMLDAA